MRLLCLGDSYTIGEGVPPRESWPHRVAAALREGGPQTGGVEAAPPTVIAQTGWTTEDLGAALDAAPPDGPFDAVTLLVGVNDQYRRPDADAYRGRFAALLARSVALAGGVAGRVVVVSTPDWGRTPHGAAPPEDADVPARTPGEIAREIDAFNAAARTEAERAGAGWVDVTDLSREQGHLVVADGLHPSGAAYQAWAARIAPAVRAALAL